MSSLEFQNVSYIKDNTAILKDITISINQGDYVSVIGPSGSGKSTFLKLICNLINPSEGVILYKNKSIMEYDPIEFRKNVAYCFQTPYLFGDTVMDNITFPYEIRDSEVDLERVEELFALFNLDKDYLYKKVINLSGGEKQRIALIRSLLFKPEVLLLDEVTSALDADNAEIVENIMNHLSQLGTTIIWITHNMEQSKRNANKLLTIEAGKIKTMEVLK
ncbi:MAG: ATP-binding cassette domain-containing protein [Tissierellaceae bacterium]|nr:ATP-binding cassette domain-containing protein [Tissierellaceae bacterium]